MAPDTKCLSRLGVNCFYLFEKGSPGMEFAHLLMELY